MLRSLLRVPSHVRMPLRSAPGPKALNSALLLRQRHQASSSPAAVESQDEHKPIERVTSLLGERLQPPLASAALPRLRLRPYQRDCIEACIQALRHGWTRIGVSAPTGSGKTAMFVALVKRIAPLKHSDWLADRVLILVGSVELARQAAAAVAMIWPDLSVEIEQGKSIASGLADVTVATYQTLATNNFARLAKFDPELYKAVIVDEAHHSSATSYLSILSHFNSSVRQPFDVSNADIAPTPAAPIAPPSTIPANADGEAIETEPARAAHKDAEWRTLVPILGFTATFGRADGKALGKVYEKVVWHAEWLDMIRAGWLSELHFTTVRLGKEVLDLDKVETSASSGEFVTSSLSAEVSKSSVTDLTVRAWLDRAQTRRSTLVFAVTINHINALVASFRERGIDARFIYEGSHPKERAATLAGFKAGEFPVLVNCGILTEGADVPAIDCILLARPTRSQNLFLQMIGRGLRLSPETGKTNCLIIDLVGNSTRGAINTPTLFGIDPDAFTADEMTSEELEELSKETNAQVVDYVMPSDESEVTYQDFASFSELVGQPGRSGSEDEVRIRDLSRLSWISIGDGTFVLEVPREGYLKIQRESVGKVEESGFYAGYWYAVRQYRDRKFRAAPVEIATHPELPILVRTMDAWFVSKRNELFPGQPLSSFETRARWRQAAPSSAQIDTIARSYKSAYEEEIKAGIVTPTADSTKDGEIEVRDIAGVWVDRPVAERVELASLTRGEASDVLTRLLRGSLGIYKKQLKGIAKVQRKKATEARRKGRKLVTSRL